MVSNMPANLLNVPAGSQNLEFQQTNGAHPNGPLTDSNLEDEDEDEKPIVLLPSHFPLLTSFSANTRAPTPNLRRHDANVREPRPHAVAASRPTGH